MGGVGPGDWLGLGQGGEEGNREYFIRNER